MKYAHTNIISGDWKSLANFYIQVFECSLLPPERNISGDWLSKGTGVQNAEITGVHLRLPGYGDSGPTLEIFQFSHMEEQLRCVPNRKGFRHIAFEVEDVNATLAAVLLHGGRKCGEVVTKSVEGVGNLVFTYLEDPEGNIIEVQNWS